MTMLPYRIPAQSLAPLAILAAGLWAPAAEAAGVLQFREPRMNVREGETREITVIRSGSSSGEVTVVLNVGLGGTATLGEDYTVELPLGVVRIPDGALFGRVSLDVAADDNVEGTEYVVLTLANPTGATLAREQSLLLQIEDGDAAQADFEILGAAIQRVTAGSELPIEVSRSGLEAETLAVDLFGVPDTAALGIDYSDLTITLEFAPAEDLAEATLSTIARTEPGGPRTLSLMLANPVPAGEAAFAGLGPLIIIEAPAGSRAGEFSLFSATPRVDEVDGSVQLTVDRNRGSTGDVTVSWVTVDGEGSRAAIAGEDYVASTGTLDFAAGETRKTFEISLVAGDAARRERRFEVVLANPTGDAGIDPEGRRVTITIRADEGVSEKECKGFCDCFIATAAWGSWMDPHVATLRNFRDDVLMRHAAGRAFAAFYYRYSPPLARLIGRHELLRAATRAALAPLVFAIERPAAAGGLLLSGLLVIVCLRRTAKRKPAA
jgi:hypothetical protein